jgi:GAF domain-containing protein
MRSPNPSRGTQGSTELERHARRLAVQYEIARAFAEAESFDEVSGLLLRTLVDALDWQCAAIWVLDADGATLRCAAIHPSEGQLATWAEASTSMRLPIGTGLPGRVWESGAAAWISDTDHDENFPRRRVAHEVGLRHGYAFPVRVRGVLAAVIEIFAAEVRAVDADEADFLQGTGHQLGSFIERIESRRAVARSEARKTGTCGPRSTPSSPPTTAVGSSTSTPPRKRCSGGGERRSWGAGSWTCSYRRG